MRLLHVGPLPPTQSGVADYSADLLGELGQMADVTVVVGDDGPLPDGPWRVLRASEVRGGFDAALYQVGNHRAHAFGLELLGRFPGVLVLHDAMLHHLYADALLARGRLAEYWRMTVYEGAAEAGFTAAIGAARPAWERDRLIGRAIDRSIGVIVHSRSAAAAVLAARPRARVRMVHHGVAAPVIVEEPVGPFTVGTFGSLTDEKRIGSVVAAMGQLPDARLLLVGEPSAAVLSRTDSGVQATGRVALAEMERLMATCHVCVQLRWPTSGEASGPVMRALRFGRPTVVSDVGWFAELPDEAVRKIPAGLSEVEEGAALAAMLRELAERPDERAQMGWAARELAARWSWRAAAERYMEVLREPDQACRAAAGGTGSRGPEQPGGAFLATA